MDERNDQELADQELADRAAADVAGAPPLTAQQREVIAAAAEVARRKA